MAARLLGTEGECAHVRVQSVGADHQVEPARPTAFENHLYAVFVLLERRDRVVEEVLHVGPRRGVQDLDEVTAEELELTAERLGCCRGDGPAGLVDVDHAAHAGGACPGGGEQAHPVEHRQGRAAEVDRVTAGPGRRGSFDDGRGEAEPPQPVGQRWAGHART
nr:hypothetical protein [Kribbella sp. VKM Ac-2527]